jgi:hypothetical protein
LLPIHIHNTYGRVESGGAANAAAKSPTGSGISHGRFAAHAFLCRNNGAAAIMDKTSRLLGFNVFSRNRSGDPTSFRHRYTYYF